MKIIIMTMHPSNEPNGFDNLSLDIQKLYQAHPLDPAPKEISKPVWTNSIFHTFYRAPWLPLRWREYLWHAFRRTGLDLTWFETFKEYWTTILSGRPLWGVQDFYFLRGIFRIRFQTSSVEDSASVDQHAQAWQKQEVLYQLLHLVYKESILTELNIARHIKKWQPKWRSLLDYGCATAPIATTLFEFGLVGSDQQIILSDLETAAFHYAKYKFSSVKAVTCIALKGESNFQISLPPASTDIITCITVFEHLNDPINVIKNFHRILSNEGVLMFDYIKGDGQGLDTMAAVNYRSEVLDYIRDNFTLLHGHLDWEKSMGLTVVRKK